MDENNLDKLRELVEFLKANGIAEFESERDNVKLRLKFASTYTAAAAGADVEQLARLLSSSAPSVAGAPAGVPGTAAAAEAKSETKPALHQVKSPIVGTFYDSPSPGAAPFVKVGDIVELGQVLCIVEAMKLMNEIEADVAGEIVERIATGGQPVEYGQALFAIKAH